MLTRSLLFRIAGPTIFMSLLFLGSCITAALYLHHQQSASVRVLDEAIASRKIAGELLKALDDLAALPADRWGEAGALHGHILGLLARARQGVDKTEEARLVGRLEDSFGRYLRREAQAASGPARGTAGREALRTLEAEVVPTCRELERFNAAEIERAEAILHRTVAWMAWGLAGVGGVGSLAGLLLGYGVARGLGRAVLRAETLAEVGELAAGMAHELRNPLTAIKMLVQTNREEAEARGLPAEDLQVIEKEILRMEGRLNVFIDFARPPKPERRRVDLAAVVDQTLALVGGRARKQRVALKFTPPVDPGRGRGRRRAGPAIAGQPRPERPRRHAAGRHAGDRAPSPGERPRRAGRARHRARHRAAAPLPAVRAVLHQQGDRPRPGPGRLAADRAGPRRQPPGDEPAAGRGLLRPPPARGATGRARTPFGMDDSCSTDYRFRDPGTSSDLSTTSYEPIGPRTRVSKQGPGIFSGTDMATILVIDDELSILHAFRRAFDDPDDVLLTAPDAAEGLEVVARSRPDVVVLDLNLPDMSGLEVFDRIRRIDARIPVIFITGQGTTETAIEAMKLGAFDYLLKPLDVGPRARAGRAGRRRSAG